MCGDRSYECLEGMSDRNIMSDIVDMSSNSSQVVPLHYTVTLPLPSTADMKTFFIIKSPLPSLPLSSHPPILRFLFSFKYLM